MFLYSVFVVKMLVIICLCLVAYCTAVFGLVWTAGTASCTVPFRARWHKKRPEPGFSFVMFSFVYVL